MTGDNFHAELRAGEGKPLSDAVPVKTEAAAYVKIPIGLLVLPSELVHTYAAIKSFDWDPRQGQERQGCTASAATLARMTGKHLRQTRTNLARLAAFGAIEIGREIGQVSRIICTPELFDSSAVKCTTPVQSTAPVQSNAGAVKCTTPVQSTAQDPCSLLPQPVQSTAPELDHELDHELETVTRSVAGGSSTAPAPLELTAQRAKRKKAAESPPTAATWTAYSGAYRQRYGVDPVRNVKVSGQLAQLIKRLGAEEAPQVAAWYVGHAGGWYAEKGHGVGLLLADAEKLRMEWASGNVITRAAVRQAERMQPIVKLIREAEEREAAAREVDQ